VSPAPSPAERGRLEREWSLSPDRSLVLAVGRLVPAKNYGLAIRALVDVPGATLAIVGEGALSDALKAQVEASGVADRVVFAGLRSDARALMGAADAVVVSSRAEGLPMVVLEALAAGTPLVATSVRGIKEVLADEENALLVAPDDATQLARALNRVLADRELASRLTAAGRNLAMHHSDQAMVATFLDAYARYAA
jgi:glycosyltransferase involved in cell wall biosynthesis